MPMTAPQSPRPTQPSAPTPLEPDTVPVRTDSPKQLVGIYVKGMAMGAADIVPGVSGGTIALIAGIYERLINAPLVVCHCSRPRLAYRICFLQGQLLFVP